MLRRFYHRILALSASPRAPWWLAAIAFAEASFFPIPPDVLLIPMALARPRRAWWLALICTAGSVVGGAVGYLIGETLFEQLAQPLIRAYGKEEIFNLYRTTFADNGFRIIMIKGALPIPYKIVTILAGASGMDFWMFMVASTLTRGARFFLEAGLLRYIGEPAQEFIEKRLTLVTTVSAVLVVFGFVAIRYWDVALSYL
jgi:membrane protein YqaA with SNARE-associated domain